MEEKPSLGESKKLKIGDLVQWRHWSDGWVPVTGVVTQVMTTRLAGRRIVMAKVTTTSTASTTIRVGQELELNPLSLRIISTSPISD